MGLSSNIAITGLAIAIAAVILVGHPLWRSLALPACFRHVVYTSEDYAWRYVGPARANGKSDSGVPSFLVR